MARLAWILAAALMVALAGCSDDSPTNAKDDADAHGSDGSAGTGSSGDMGGNVSVENVSTVTVSAVGAYPVSPAFDPEAIEVDAGSMLEVTFKNEDDNPVISHNWVFEPTGEASETIDPGETTVMQLRVPTEPGDYAYFCSIGDHRERGMEGMLRVV